MTTRVRLLRRLDYVLPSVRKTVKTEILWSGDLCVEPKLKKAYKYIPCADGWVEIVTVPYPTILHSVDNIEQGTRFIYSDTLWAEGETLFTASSELPPKKTRNTVLPSVPVPSPPPDSPQSPPRSSPPPPPPSVKRTRLSKLKQQRESREVEHRPQNDAQLTALLAKFPTWTGEPAK